MEFGGGNSNGQTGMLLEGYIVSTGVSNAQKGQVKGIAAPLNSTVQITDVKVNTQTSTVDSTVSQDLVITFTTPSNAGCVTEGVIVEKLTKPSMDYNSGVVAIAATGTQDVAHGISGTPSHIRITAYAATGIGLTGPVVNSIGSYNGTDTNTLFQAYTTSGSGFMLSNIETTNIIYLQVPGTGTTSATVTMDPTNITLTISNAVPGYIFWEAYI